KKACWNMSRPRPCRKAADTQRLFSMIQAGVSCVGFFASAITSEANPPSKTQGTPARGARVRQETWIIAPQILCSKSTSQMRFYGPANPADLFACRQAPTKALPRVYPANQRRKTGKSPGRAATVLHKSTGQGCGQPCYNPHNRAWLQGCRIPGEVLASAP